MISWCALQWQRISTLVVLESMLKGEPQKELFPTKIAMHSKGSTIRLGIKPENIIN
jgi:hypothetical protein